MPHLLSSWLAIEQQTTCWFCEGRGYVIGGRVTDNGWREPPKMPCPVCGGRGIVRDDRLAKQKEAR